jgi:hypothetical protein
MDYESASRDVAVEILNAILIWNLIACYDFEIAMSCAFLSKIGGDGEILRLILID